MPLSSEQERASSESEAVSRPSSPFPPESAALDIDNYSPEHEDEDSSSEYIIEQEPTTEPLDASSPSDPLLSTPTTSNPSDLPLTDTPPSRDPRRAEFGPFARGLQRNKRNREDHDEEGEREGRRAFVRTEEPLGSSRWDDETAVETMG